MLFRVESFLRAIGTAATSIRQSSSTSPLKHLAKNAQFGKQSGVFSKITMPPEPQPEIPRRTKSSWSRKFSILGNVLFFGTIGAGSYFGYYTYMYEPDEVKKIVEEQRSLGYPGSEAWCRMMEFYLEKRQYLNGEIDRFSKPRQDNLLPDQIHPHRKTLVLDLDELLVHSDWTRERGWKVLKRPGLEMFLKEMLPYFEVVVYSDQLFTYVEPVMDRVDPERMIYRLHRTDTLYVNGKHVRDLSRLGRDMSKVLMISAKPDAWANHPENTLKLGAWKGSSGDTLLLDLIPFLKFAAQRVGLDMRKLVDAYDGKDIPTTFKARMQELEMQQQKSHSSRGFLGSYVSR